MRLHQWWMSARLGKSVAFGLVLAALVAEGGSSWVAAGGAQAKLEATIFTYDGQDFLRTRTTLLTADGKSAVNTKLDRETPAYKALIQKRSYTGAATVFGRAYDASYAPLTSEDGRLTGALFVAVAK